MFDKQIGDILNFSGIQKGLDILNNRPSVGSLSDADNEFTSDEMNRFLMNSQNIQESQITGSELFPGEFLHPKSDNEILSGEMLNRMVEYYNAAYDSYNFRRPFGDGEEDSIVIRVKINKFGRCRIGSETIGSTMSSRHTKSSFILAKFETQDGQVDCYPGQVQYFFNHSVDFSDDVRSDHYLAYVRWYRPADTSNVRFHFSSDDEYQTCNVELWKNDFYPEGRDCIIPVHHILSRFIPTTYKISSRRNAANYLAINPINRKLHIH